MWRTLQCLAAEEGDVNTVILRAVEEYLSRAHRQRTKARPGKYKKLVEALSTPVAALKLSARSATCLQQLNIHYVYELVAKSPRDLQMMSNFGPKSFREVQEILAALGLSLGMELDGPSYSGAVLATVAASIAAIPE
jgi:DNA-directed RNA polymerase alpha subunit